MKAAVCLWLGVIKFCSNGRIESYECLKDVLLQISHRLCNARFLICRYWSEIKRNRFDRHTSKMTTAAWHTQIVTRNTTYYIEFTAIMSGTSHLLFNIVVCKAAVINSRLKLPYTNTQPSHNKCAFVNIRDNVTCIHFICIISTFLKWRTSHYMFRY